MRLSDIVTRWGSAVAVAVTALVLVLGLASYAGAQVINPTTVEFDVSADHNVTVLGQPAVASYELRIYAVGAQAPVTTVDLGKPTPTGIRARVTNPAIFTPLDKGEYIARVVAIGPGGDGVSDPTVPFGRMTAPAKPTAPGVTR